MTCTAQSRMTLEEQLAKAEDCVKFDEVYYKLLGEDSTYHLFQQVFNSFACKLFVYISVSHLQNPLLFCAPRKVDKVLCDRAVYRQSKGEAWGDSYLFYEGPQSRWKRGSDAKVGEPSLNVSRTIIV